MIHDLFGNPIEIKSESPKKQKRKLAKSHYRARIDSFYQSDIERHLETTSIYDMPVVKANTIIPQFTTITPFDRIKTSSNDSIVIFYTHDNRFAPALNHPWDYIELLKPFVGVLGPDLSQYNDMNYAIRLHNSYWNKAITAYLQNNGVNMYPNVTWNLPNSYEYSVAGLPKHSVIAINSIGALSSNFSESVWLNGYNYMVKELQPIWILRYGPKINGEYEEISSYLPNVQLQIMRDNGRKRNRK